MAKQPKRVMDRFDLEAEREGQATRRRAEIAPDRRNRHMSEEEGQEIEQRQERSKSRFEKEEGIDGR